MKRYTEGNLVARVRSALTTQAPAKPALTLGITDEEIDLIASDGMRNAAGGIYETSVYKFAHGIERVVLARWHAAPVEPGNPANQADMRKVAQALTAKIKLACSETPTAINGYGIKLWEKIENDIAAALAGSAGDPKGDRA